MYNKKLFFTNQKSALYIPTYTHTYTQFLLTHIGTGEFFSNSEIIKLAAKDLCIPQFKAIAGICEDILFLICGFNPDNTNIVSHLL